jgi:ferritin
MISERMTKALNEQIREEFSSGYIYLAMVGCFDAMGLKVFAQRFLKQTEEEFGHAHKMLHYVLEQGGKVFLHATPEPKNEYESAEQMVAAALNHEKYITGRINQLADLAEEEKDRATRSFLNWYIDEQVEEEASMAELLQLLQLAGPQQIFNVENRLARMMASE